MQISETPFYWEPDTRSADIDSHRKMSITRYSTFVPFNCNTLLSTFSNNMLKRNDEFGCIGINEYSDSTIHVMMAKINKNGFKSPKFNELDTFLSVDNFRIKVISATIHIDHFPDENSRLNLLVFNKGNIRKNRLFATYRKLFDITNLEQMKFDERVLRELCFEKFPDSLYEINIDSTNCPNYGVQTVDLKSNTRIIKEAEKINEIKENKEIKITGFKSFIYSKCDNLKEDCRVKFSIDSMSGTIVLEFPKLTWSDAEIKNEKEKEEDFYNYARKVYNEIINVSGVRILDTSQKKLALWVHNDYK